MNDPFEKYERTAIAEEPVTLLLVLGLVLCGVAILLLSDFVGVTVVGAFIGKLVGLSIVNASVVGYVTIGAVGVFGLGLVCYSFYSSSSFNALDTSLADVVWGNSDLAEGQEEVGGLWQGRSPKAEIQSSLTNPPLLDNFNSSGNSDCLSVVF